MEYPTPAIRYRHDPTFHEFVDALCELLADGTFTRPDLDDAVTLAKQAFELGVKQHTPETH